MVFPNTSCTSGLDLLLLARSQQKRLVPEDVREEVFRAIQADERLKAGDWILINGASAVTGQMAIQLAKLAGLKVIAVACAKRHGDRLHNLGADVVVDRHDLQNAAADITKATGGRILFALDTVGKQTAAWCQEVLSQQASVNSAGHPPAQRRSHLVGLSGMPKDQHASVHQHILPIKLFHENRVLGSVTVQWLGELLEEGIIKLPDVEVAEGGLASVNSNLDRLRRGEASGKRIVISMN